MPLRELNGLRAQCEAGDFADALEAFAAAFEQTSSVQPEEHLAVALETRLDSTADFGADIPRIDEDVEPAFGEVLAVGEVTEEVVADAQAAAHEGLTDVADKDVKCIFIGQVGERAFVHEEGDIGGSLGEPRRAS